LQNFLLYIAKIVFFGHTMQIKLQITALSLNLTNIFMYTLHLLPLAIIMLIWIGTEFVFCM
jgi:hypothetical protein